MTLKPLTVPQSSPGQTGAGREVLPLHLPLRPGTSGKLQLGQGLLQKPCSSPRL